MIKTQTHVLALCLAAAFVAAGCASKVPLAEKTEVPVENRTGSAAGGAGAAGAGGAQSSVATVNAGSAASAAAPRIVYFDFDSFTIKDEFRPVIETSAKSLSTVRTKRVTIEGHTDERGGREYNLALGQKRAETVARAMTLLGAQDAQIEAVSFGKERPAVQGSDEAAWARNRRAEIKEK